MPSARPHNSTRLGLLAVCCLLLVGAVTGCTTTQETAAKRQAESKRFLKEREARRDRKSQVEGSEQANDDFPV